MQLSAAETPSAAAAQEPVSVSKALDEQDSVELVDTETGETRLICKRVPTTGSRLGSQKVCATPKQWDDVRRKSQELVGREQRGKTRLPPPGGTHDTPYGH